MEQCQIKDEIKEAQKKGYPYYVYELFDPQDNKVFYIGKGKNLRCFEHVKEADKNETCNYKKTNKIKSVVSKYGNIGVKINSYFINEEEAYKHETNLIRENKADLTNIHINAREVFGNERAKALALLERIIPYNYWKLYRIKMGMYTERDYKDYCAVVEGLLQISKINLCMFVKYMQQKEKSLGIKLKTPKMA